MYFSNDDFLQLIVLSLFREIMIASMFFDEVLLSEFLTTFSSKKMLLQLTLKMSRTRDDIYCIFLVPCEIFLSTIHGKRYRHSFCRFTKTKIFDET